MFKACFRPHSLGRDGEESWSSSDSSSGSDSGFLGAKKPARKRAKSSQHPRARSSRASSLFQQKPASWPEAERQRSAPCACDSSSDVASSSAASDSDSLDSVDTAAGPALPRAIAAAAAQLPPLPLRYYHQQPHRVSTPPPPLPQPLAPLPPRHPPGNSSADDGLFTPASFASHREPLAGNLRYRKIRDLNRGSVGFVQLARDVVSGAAVAIKFVQRDHPSLAASLLLREIGNQRAAAGHPHVVQLLEVFVTQWHVALVMEYCNGGDLSQYIEHCMVTEGHALPEERAARLFQQLLVAIDFCHRLGIANRDIKLDNLLLHHPAGGAPPQLKLCDFGLSKDEVESAAASSCGTPEYMAPEVLLGAAYRGCTVDVWCAGVTLYTLVAGAFPFLKVEEEAGSPVARMAAMMPRIVRAEYQPLPSTVSPECADLLACMLTADPVARISVPEMLAHPWVTRHGSPLLPRLNSGLLALMGLAEHPAAVAAAAEATERGLPPRPASAAGHHRRTPFLLDVDGGAARASDCGGSGGSSSSQDARYERQRRAASLDLPRIGAVAANRAALRAGGCRQSLAEIAALLSEAQAATAAEHRRAVRSLDLAASRAAAAARCQPAWQLDGTPTCLA